MASNSKVAEKQIVALFRLEFYKNKKDWKLCDDVRKETLPSPKKINKVNKTYNVGEDLPKENDPELSIHNKAFVDEEPQEPGPHSEWPSPNGHLSDKFTDNNCCPPVYLSPECPSPECFGPVCPSPECFGPVCPSPESFGPVCPSTECLSLNGHLSEKNTDNYYPSHLELKPAEDSLDLPLEYLTPSQMRQAAGDWLTLHGVPVEQVEYSDTFDECVITNESDDFVRGAHYVPHSSEIELSVSQECPCSCNESLCVMSMNQLARAIRRHHLALTRLLREQALRGRLSTQSLLPYDVNPTHYKFPLQAPDIVLSSSQLVQMKADPFADVIGRGRGRLQRNIIGINMGRPYRI